MFKRFALCLSPAILAYIIVVVMGLTSALGSEDVMLTVATVLIGIGAIGSGICVGLKVYRSMDSPTWVRWVVSILTFLGVGIAYLAVGFAGCCGLALTSGSFS